MIVKDKIIVIAIEGLTFLLMTCRIFAHAERVCTHFGEQAQTSSDAGKIEKPLQKAMDTLKLLYPRRKTSSAGIWYKGVIREIREKRNRGTIGSQAELQSQMSGCCRRGKSG